MIDDAFQGQDAHGLLALRPLDWGACIGPYHAAGTRAMDQPVHPDRQVIRVGSRAPRCVDVRFLSATNRDLEAEGPTR